jgi:hypothetical protein
MAAKYRLKDMPLVLVNNFLAGTNTYMRGKPGIGKTHMIVEFGAEMQRRLPAFRLWQFYAPTMSPMDIIASAPDYEKGTLKLYANEALPNVYGKYTVANADGTTSVIEGKDLQGAVFFGELPNADPATIKLLQKYINGEDMSGNMRKPDGVVVIADGNRIEDKSGVQQQGRAFLSRFEQLEVYVEVDDCIKYAEAHSWHPNVQLFFKDHPALIDNYDEVFEMGDAALQRSAQQRNTNGSNEQTEEGKLGIWCNMRAWERISKKEYVADQMNRKVTQSEVAGNIGTAAAAQYEAHRNIISKLASFDSIMANPDTVALPTKMDEQYMLSVLVALRAKSEQMPQVRTFGERMPLEFQAVILRTMTGRKGFNLAATQDYLQWIRNKALTDLLNGR